MNKVATKRNIDALSGLVETLRGRNGCPWDKKQTPRSMAVYLLEETYELVEAIEDGDPVKICEELGDVLFLILFVTKLFQEKGQFDIGEVIGFAYEKMVRRHPHVFGEGKVKTADEVRQQWHHIKLKEKSHVRNKSILDSVPPNSSIISSCTILMTCCEAVSDSRISRPTAFSRTLAQNFFATPK